MRPLLRLALLLFVPVALSAQIPEGFEDTAFEPHPEAAKAIGSLFSPYCPGFMLGVCQAPQSTILRDSIQALAYQGWSSDEIVEWMLANHGEEYRAVPERSGWAMWAWLLPPLGLLTGIAVFGLALRRFRPEPVEVGGEGSGPSISSEEEEKLRLAIREIELSEDPSF